MAFNSLLEQIHVFMNKMHTEKYQTYLALSDKNLETKLLLFLAAWES